MDDHRSEVRLTASECARRMGLSVRTLRVHERHGLISPQRTGKDWRLYGANEVTRLNEVLALKALGLSLSRIADLLNGKSTDLGRTLAVQREALQGICQRAQRGLAMIGTLQDKLAGGAALTITDLTNLAKESSMVEPTDNAVAWRRYEQNRPRTEVSINPSIYEVYSGSYQLQDGPYYIVSAKDGRLFTRVVGQSDIEIFPESETEFFMKALPVQVTFHRGDDGQVSSLTHHQNGAEIRATRVDDQIAKTAEEDLMARIRNKTAFPNSESIIHRVVAEHVRGQPDYNGMAPPLAALAKQQSEQIKAEMARAGDVEDILFKGVSQAGWDVYEVRFANINMEWSLFLGADGKLHGLFFRPTP